MTKKNRHILSLINKAAKASKLKVGYYNCSYEEYNELSKIIDDGCYEEATEKERAASDKAEKKLDSLLVETYLTAEIIHEDCFDGSDEYYKDQKLVKGGDGAEFLSVYASLDDPVHFSGENISFDIEKDELNALYNMTDDEIFEKYKKHFEDELDSYYEYEYLAY